MESGLGSPSQSWLSPMFSMIPTLTEQDVYGAKEMDVIGREQVDRVILLTMVV